MSNQYCKFCREPRDTINSVWIFTCGTYIANNGHFVRSRQCMKSQIKTLEIENKDLHTLTQRQGDNLTRVVNAIRGEPAPLHLHSHHDVGERAEKVVAAAAQLASACEAAKSHIETWHRDTVVLEQIDAALAAAKEANK